jgi:acyl-CoA thioesterase
MAEALNSTAFASPQALIDHLMRRDKFSQWLGIEVVEAAVGRSVLRMTVRDDMVNGFGSSHGGIVFGLADSAFAFAINADGTLSVAIDCTVSFPVAVRPGDVLTAIAVEESKSNKLTFLVATVRNQHDVIVGHFRGTGYRTGRPHQADA